MAADVNQLDDLRTILEWAQQDPLPALGRESQRNLVDALWRTSSPFSSSSPAARSGRSVSWRGGQPLAVQHDTLKDFRRRGADILQTVIGPLRQMLSPVTQEPAQSAEISGVAIRLDDRHPDQVGPHMWVLFHPDQSRYQRLLAFPWPTGFFVQFAGLLEQHGELVRRCASCGKVFLRTKRQEYCSGACSQRVRSQRWYAGHRAAARSKRRQHYEREQRLKVGAPKLKIRRRA